VPSTFAAIQGPTLTNPQQNSATVNKLAGDKLGPVYPQNDITDMREGDDDVQTIHLTIDPHSATLLSQENKTDEPRSKPFICFYCGFQCESHLMRHRCVPKKKRRTLSLDYENYDPRNLVIGSNGFTQGSRNGAGASAISTMESEAAEILSVMLQSA
jgi:hypothetical protein